FRSRCFSGLCNCAGRQQFVNLSGVLVYFAARRKLITFKRGRCHGPYEASLFAERVFQQNRGRIQLFLNLFYRKRPGLRYRCIDGTVLSDKRLHLLIVALESSNLAVEVSDLLLASAFLGAELDLALGLRVEDPP